MEPEDYAIYQTWDWIVENFDYLMGSDMFLWSIGVTALIAFILGRLSK